MHTCSTVGAHQVNAQDPLLIKLLWEHIQTYPSMTSRTSERIIRAPTHPEHGSSPSTVPHMLRGAQQARDHRALCASSPFPSVHHTACAGGQNASSWHLTHPEHGSSPSSVSYMLRGAQRGMDHRTLCASSPFPSKHHTACPYERTGQNTSSRALPSLSTVAN